MGDERAAVARALVLLARRLVELRVVNRDVVFHFGQLDDGASDQLRNNFVKILRRFYETPITT